MYHMTNQFELDIFTETKKEDGISSTGYKDRFADNKYPAIFIELSDDVVVSISENLLSAGSIEIELENKTIQEVIKILLDNNINCSLLSNKIALYPATLLEDFCSKEVIVCDIIKSPFKYKNILSKLVNNITPDKLSSSLSVEFVAAYNKDNVSIEPSLIDIDNIYFSQLDNNTKALFDTSLSSMILFVSDEKISNSYKVIDNISSNHFKNQLLTSITSYNISKI